jgi:hypothetical protein
MDLSMFRGWPTFWWPFIRVICALWLSMSAATAGIAAGYDWALVPAIKMGGDLHLFWDVNDWNKTSHAQAYARGFRPITLVDTFRSVKPEERIDNYLGTANRNPWQRPWFFDSVVRQNVQRSHVYDTFVHDIEFTFEPDARVAWADPVVRSASKASTFEEFRDAYVREWASWFQSPLRLTRELYPNIKIGLYGRQPFDRDYWGIANKTIEQIESKHVEDLRLWKLLDPFVDLYIVDIYNFYDVPDSVFYMAANVEFNFHRARQLGGKPIYVYEWMRYHDSNAKEANRELDPFLVEAMAVVPYFSGAKGIVVWGAEPQLKDGDGHAYQHLPLFAKTAARVAGLSELISKGTLIFDKPAHALWTAKAPLVRVVDVGTSGCVVLAINPWQADAGTSTADATCGGRVFKLVMHGRHATLAHIVGDQVTLH